MVMGTSTEVIFLQWLSACPKKAATVRGNPVTGPAAMSSSPPARPGTHGASAARCAAGLCVACWTARPAGAGGGAAARGGPADVLVHRPVAAGDVFLSGRGRPPRATLPRDPQTEE